MFSVFLFVAFATKLPSGIVFRLKARRDSKLKVIFNDLNDLNCFVGNALFLQCVFVFLIENHVFYHICVCSLRVCYTPRFWPSNKKNNKGVSL